MKPLKITVIGGGSSYTPELIEGILKRYTELPVKTLYLYDIAEGQEKLAIIEALAKRMVEKSNQEIEVIATLNRIEAIKDADFILTQIRVGGLMARAKDEYIPLTYKAIGQETTGAGGFAKALRTIPVILDICKEIEAYAKDAWLINFTNPAGMITEAVKRYTNVKVIGLCNVPIGMKNNIASLLKVPKTQVKIDFVGLNHLVWGTKVYLNDEEVTSKVIDLLCDNDLGNMKNIPDLKWDSEFLRTLNMVPCPYHRYFYMKAEMLEEELSHIGDTRANQVMTIEKELFETYKDVNLCEKPEALEKRGGAYYSDAAIALISAIYNDKGQIHTVNTLNKGAVANLPDDVVIEINCIVDRKGAHPIAFGVLPDPINGWVQMVKAYEIMTIKAAVTGDYQMALNALYTHPLIDSAEQARLILNALLDAHKGYLDYFNEASFNH